VTDRFTHEHAMTLLESAPFGVIATDGKNLLWLNERAEKMTGLNSRGLIGQPVERLPDWLTKIFNEGCEENQLSGEAGCEVLASVKSFDSVPLTTACFLTDASQIRQLQNHIRDLEKRVELLDTRDNVSGLLNQRGLLQILEAQVTRSRRYGNPLSIIGLTIEDYGVGDDRKGDVLAAIGYLFNDRLRWADCVGRLDENEFVLVLPETDAVSVAILGDKLTNEFKTLPLPGGGDTVALSVNLKKATWKEGDDPTRLLLRCRAAVRS